jgi:hypothetical protein
MLPLYVGSLALGGVLIAATILLGDADTDVDIDADFDVDADLDVGGAGDHDVSLILKDPSDAMVEAGTWLPFFSLRFWTFALASFGASGASLHLLGVTGILGAVVSGVLGFGIGTGAAWVFRQLQLSQPSGNVAMLDVRGTEATVLLSVGPGKVGKVRVVVDGQHIDLPATTHGASTLNRNGKALILSMENGIADITPVPLGYKSVALED